MALKKGELHTGTIREVLYPNKGVMIVDDLPEQSESTEGQSAPEVIVKNTIPGQRIRCRINKKHSGRCEGQLLEVVEKSPLETEPAGCSIFPACGGCLYRTMSYSDELSMKEKQIRTLMEKTMTAGGQDDCPFEGITGSPVADAYRNKMEFAFGDAEKGGPLTLGLHKKNSRYDILTASDCRIVHEDFNRISSCVLQFYREKNWTYMNKISHLGYLRHLLIRRAYMTGEILVDLVTTSQFPGEGSSDQTISQLSAEDIPVHNDIADKEESQNTADTDEAQALKELADRILKLPLEGRITGILHTVNDSVADVIRNDRTDVLWGRDFFYEELLGLKFRITPFSFFQTNSAGAEILYRTARDFLGDVHGRTVFDLYSGTGTIAQMMAPVCDQVVGVEIVPEAVEAARENAVLNGLSNCRFIAGDVLKVLDELEEKPDTIILDPPRDGVHPKALPKILAYGVDRIVYISCKATSLARDLPIMMQHGYRVERIRCVDMFPRTQHVETVVLMSRRRD
ncbi:MAG: 23S rRNA (uracil(1939)-C(5))-methyltransferase RlmD [Eubacteriales bacterium]|jgi:23S rRNA (uracil1939-C5)-methyltransferase